MISLYTIFNFVPNRRMKTFKERIKMCSICVVFTTTRNTFMVSNFNMEVAYLVYYSCLYSINICIVNARGPCVVHTLHKKCS